jgi:hypothetical protein
LIVSLTEAPTATSHLNAVLTDAPTIAGGTGLTDAPTTTDVGCLSLAFHPTTKVDC